MRHVIFYFFTITTIAACSSGTPVKNNSAGNDSLTVKDPGTLYAFEQSDKTGFKDSKGTIIIPAKYTYAFTDTFNHKIVFVADSANQIVAIDKAGNKVLTPFIFDNGPDYIEEGLFRFTENGKIGFADEDGNIIIPAKFDFVTEFKESLACFGSGFTRERAGEIELMKGGKWGFINKKGETVIPQQYDEMAYFENGKCAVKMNGKTVEIDKNGREMK